MEPHAIPRQITSFEFKLIGFLTLKQFLYIVLFCGIGILVYIATPIPYLNVVIAGIFVGIGLLFAFFKYNERGLDTWIKNVFVRLFSPSQYFYKKNNPPVLFLQGIPKTDKIVKETHIDAQQKINKYLDSINPQAKPIIEPDVQPEIIAENNIPEPKIETEQNIEPEPKTEPLENKNDSVPITTGPENKPFLSGFISNRKGVRLPNVLIYIKNQSKENVRILKTNHDGSFNSFSKLDGGEYLIEIKDPRDIYFFDTMTLEVAEDAPLPPLTITSKEVI